MGGLVEAYQEVARRLGILVENGPAKPKGPVLVRSN
jgi:phosphoribosylaminoimidazole-succinocarboxamide synthase